MSRPFAVACLLLALIALPIRAFATGAFVQGLTPADRAATGFDRLTSDQRACLDAQIQHDIDSARQGDAVAFAKSFSERRSSTDRVASGLDTLTDAERARLDSLVAAAIATRPAQAFLPYAPKRTGAEGYKPDGRPRPWEVHGDVSMVVGTAGSGRSWYGGGFDVRATDPSHHVTVQVGAGELRGHVPCYYGYGWGDPIW